MKVISLFDGMGCGLEALKRAGIKVTEYHAFEIDKNAISIAKKNHPEIIHHGAITFMTDFTQFKGADLLIGGSPCQGFSMAGKQLNFKDPRSQLFFEFVRAKNEIKPKRFLLENVKMPHNIRDEISRLLKCKPILINSALVSAQNRSRYYWCNWHVKQPEDRGIFWEDIREYGVDSECYYYTDRAMEWLGRHSNKNNKLLKIHSGNEKMQMLEASGHKKYSAQRFFGIIDTPNQAIAAMRGRRIDPSTMKRADSALNIAPEQYVEFRYDGKSNCLSTVGKDNIVVPFTLANRIPLNSFFFRYLTPIECERLQTLPDNYTGGVSNTQRYKMLGNGWTIDVITHLLSVIKI